MRKALDMLVSWVGLVLTVILVVAGALLTWGSTFISNEVHTQLAAQQVMFPAADSPAVAGPQFAGMRRYGGQLMTTGAQAKVYADDFIAIHLKEAGGGKTYSQLSALSNASPNDAKLAAQVETMFRGETLRGLLLYAYAFATIGSIAGYAAIGAWIAAALMLALSVLGFWHARRRVVISPAAPPAESLP